MPMDTEKNPAKIVCTTVKLPFIRDPQRWEQDLAAALGSPTLIRWWISRMDGDIATVEAVVMVPGSLEDACDETQP